MDDVPESPQHLYRYRSLDGKSKDWTKDSILNSLHYFSSPKAFNDPFDCRPVFKLDASKAELIKYYEGVFSRQAQHMSREQRRAEARAKVSDPNSDPRNPQNLEALHRMYDEIVTSRIGVLCLSATPKDILMWSHYANSHRGICLQFFARGNTLESSQPVRYKAVRPVVNPVSQSHDEMLDRAIFTKSDHWDYEQEWRLIQYKLGAGVYRIPPEALVGIVLGALIEQQDRRDVLEWADSRDIPTKIFQARISTTKFELELNEIRN